MPNLIRLPLVFYDDHEARDLDTPEAVKRTGSHVWVRDNDPALPELLSDARYYADPFGPDMSLGFKSSARATINAIQKAAK